VAGIVGDEDAKDFGRSEVAGFPPQKPASSLHLGHHRNLMHSDWSNCQKASEVFEMW
jgi:hypothetical protein